ncbi:MAG: SH3-like domain-containing protein [Yoonia sp.]|jgi:SH3-like domain-containing protein
MGVLAHWRRLTRTAFLVVCLSASASIAQQNEMVATSGPAIGPETNLPLPRFVSLRANEANVRRGPSLSHRIDWVFKRRDMPLQVIAEYGHWRRVIDRDGQGGWVHYRMLSGARTVVIDGKETTLRARPEPDALENAMLEPGVVARLEECTPDWCQLTAGGYSGWVPKSALWGVTSTELRH